MRYDAPHGVALGSTREERLKAVPLASQNRAGITSPFG